MTSLIEQPEKNKPATLRLLISPNSAITQFLGTCPTATTLYAYSHTLENFVVCSLCCRRWGCSYCGRRKITALAARTREAAPNRLITLTIDTKLYLTPRDAFDRTRRKVGDLTNRLKKRLGSFEYFRVLEATKAGWPHYHFVARCEFVPQAWLSDQWAELTGAPIVDVRAIGRATDAYWYIVKYLGKQSHVPWTNRRVSWSRNFFPPRDKSKNVTLDLDSKDRFLEHPAQFCDQELQGATLEAVTPGCWQIVRTEGNKLLDVKLKKWLDRKHRQTANKSKS